MWMQFQWHPLTELRSESKLLDGQAIRRQPYQTIQNLTKPYQTLQNLTKTLETLQNVTKPYQTKPNHTKPDQTIQNLTKPYQTIQIQTKPNHTVYCGVVKTVQYGQEILTAHTIPYDVTPYHTIPSTAARMLGMFMSRK